MQNHYETLGVAENASQEEIKSAYRKLAMRFHPDKNPGDAAAEDKFKQVNAAYAELGEPDTRARYDQQRQFGQNSFGANPFQQGGMHFNFGFGGGGIDDIINQFFHHHGFAHGRPARNRDLIFDLHLSLEDAFFGKQVPVQFTINNQPQHLNVNIPAGIESGTKIKYQGYGDKSNANAAPGDLYIQIQIVEHPQYRRQGPHLHTSIQVDALNAIVGCDKEIKGIDGQNIRITIPPGTQPNAQLRLKERGMPNRGQPNSRGDCIVAVEVTVPTNISENDKQYIRNIINQTST